ncbi:MAG: ComF family protein [Anaerovoracaceae bacterium]
MEYFPGKQGLMRKGAELILQWIFPLSTYCLCCGKAVDDTRSYSICDHCIRHIKWGNIHIDLKSESRHLGRPPHLDSAIACVKYGLYERRLIFDLKYDGKTYVARVIGQIMADRLAAEGYAEGGPLPSGDPLPSVDPNYSAHRSADSYCSDNQQSYNGKSCCGGSKSPYRKICHYGGGFDYIVPVPVHRDREKVRGFNQAEKIARHLSGHIGVPVLPRAIVRDRRTAAQRSLSSEDRYFNMEGAFSMNSADAERIKGSSILLLDDVYTTGATAHHCGEVLKNAGAGRVDFIAFATGNDFAYGFFSD